MNTTQPTLFDSQRINRLAVQFSRPLIDLINPEEEARICELIAANTWPNKWDGTEPRADEPFEEAGEGGEVQALMDLEYDEEESINEILHGLECE